MFHFPFFSSKAMMVVIIIILLFFISDTYYVTNAMISVLEVEKCHGLHHSERIGRKKRSNLE